MSTGRRWQIVSRSTPPGPDVAIWLTESHGEWTAAYRIVEGPTGKPVVSELRVYPADDEAQPGWWDHDPAAVPLGGVPARLIRRLHVQGAADAIWADLVDAERDRSGTWSARLAELGFTKMATDLRQEAAGIETEVGFTAVAAENATHVGRMGHSDAFLAEIAAAYVDACRRGSTKPAVEVRAKMAEQNIEYSLDSVRGFIKQARARGFITDPPPGRAGGELTDSARAVLDSLRADNEDFRRRSTWVTMRHPVTGGESRVTLTAFDIWRTKGWELDEHPGEGQP